MISTHAMAFRLNKELRTTSISVDPHIPIDIFFSQLHNAQCLGFIHRVRFILIDYWALWLRVQIEITVALLPGTVIAR